MRGHSLCFNGATGESSLNYSCYPFLSGPLINRDVPGIIKCLQNSTKDTTGMPVLFRV